MDVKIYFSDIFDVTPEALEEYGAFNISLINDLPLFIDPFLLFNSDLKTYRDLHDKIIQYVHFLKKISEKEGIKPGLLRAWFHFPEIKQTWLGYSKTGNKGSGLGKKFAESLNNNLHTVFNNFGSEEITNGSHLEKLCLIREGVGRDNISDFTSNLIKGYLLEYTQVFTQKYISPKYIQSHTVSHVEFNYQTQSWVTKKFQLPTFCGDYVLLTPKDILTKDNTWINKPDMIRDFDRVIESIPNEQLRAQLNQYFIKVLPTEPEKDDITIAKTQTITKFPEFIDYFIKLKEETGDQASAISNSKVREIEHIFIQKVRELVDYLSEQSDFYEYGYDSLEAAHRRVQFLKDVIENNDGYKIFYKDGNPIKRESDLQLLFKLTWYGTKFDVNAEVNNGRGPVDFKISFGNTDKSLVELKLASNSKLKQNLQHQVKIYEQANKTNKSIKVILYFSDNEYEKVIKLFNELNLYENENLVLIDARADKPSASNVKK